MKNVIRAIVLIAIFGSYIAVQNWLEAKSQEYDRQRAELVKNRSSVSGKVSHKPDLPKVKKLEIFNNLQICKATISTIMGQDPKNMSGTLDDKYLAIVSYFRNDGTKWSYECEVVGERVSWGRVNRARIPSNIIVKESGAKPILIVTQYHSDGSVTEGKFSKSELN
ncbi:hypothetical protein [Thaumasiovibrio sp. DFM-14]|uniref:hypothetical protein n=1 Tax=Thaumasiovibrio sp. DFM-14 TaxID=3384792 RepID=UPI00399FDACB